MQRRYVSEYFQFDHIFGITNQDIQCVRLSISKNYSEVTFTFNIIFLYSDQLKGLTYTHNRQNNWKHKHLLLLQVDGMIHAEDVVLFADTRGKIKSIINIWAGKDENEGK